MLHSVSMRQLPGRRCRCHSFPNARITRRNALRLSGLFSLWALAGCQVRPLYRTTSLPTIRLTSELTDELDFFFRRRLQRLLKNGERPTPVRWTLRYRIETTTQSGIVKSGAHSIAVPSLVVTFVGTLTHAQGNERSIAIQAREDAPTWQIRRPHIDAELVRKTHRLLLKSLADNVNLRVRARLREHEDHHG